MDRRDKSSSSTPRCACGQKQAIENTLATVRQIIQPIQKFNFFINHFFSDRVKKFPNFGYYSSIN